MGRKKNINGNPWDRVIADATATEPAKMLSEAANPTKLGKTAPKMGKTISKPGKTVKNEENTPFTVPKNAKMSNRELQRKRAKGRTYMRLYRRVLRTEKMAVKLSRKKGICRKLECNVTARMIRTGLLKKGKNVMSIHTVYRDMKAAGVRKLKQKKRPFLMPNVMSQDERRKNENGVYRAAWNR